jgi:hypothetical protein
MPLAEQAEPTAAMPTPERNITDDDGDYQFSCRIGWTSGIFVLALEEMV